MQKPYCTPREVLALRAEIARLARLHETVRAETQHVVQSSLTLIEESQKLLKSLSTDAD